MQPDLPDRFNSASYFIDRHVEQGRGDHTVIVDRDGRYTYAELAQRVNAAGRAFMSLGVAQETRVALALQDTVAFPALFWGAIKAGMVPVPLNTLLMPDVYDVILRDSRARVLIVDEPLYERFAPILNNHPGLNHVFVRRENYRDKPGRFEALERDDGVIETADTCADDVAFWLYSSGSTGNPKGVKHLHRNLVYTAQTYGRHVLRIREDDTVFSAAKLFFAYGLGNSMTFPFSVGATTVLMDDRPTAETVRRTLEAHQPTVFFGIPTLFAAMLADDRVTHSPGFARVRICVSAGEPLPEDVGKRWYERFGLEILDGVGSTEMLHIYLSGRAGQVRYGSCGQAVPGYRLRLLDVDGIEVPDGDLGELYVEGLSAAEGYWRNREKSLDTFQGRWTRTGDIFYRDADGYYRYCGRNDDMFKSGGNWVSPAEVESALVRHERVLEAGVVGHADGSGNLKAKAFVVLIDPGEATRDLEQELQSFVKRQLELWKYPRWVEFVHELPKTATGKIERYKLKARGL